MELNPYQKIVKDGELIQSGEMDTPIKFGQLTEGVDLAGKHILDVGCNLGMMCNLANQQGATASGVDISKEYIDQAKEIFPNIHFDCQQAEGIFGNYDIIIASALLHYVKDLDEVFKVFSRCSKQVLCDVWLHTSEVPIFALTHRNIYIPSRSAFYNIVSKYFNTIEEKGKAITPDISERYIFHLSDPIPNPPKAVLLYGQGNTGKTTRATKYFGYKHLMTDNLFHTWMVNNLDNMKSVVFFSALINGDKREEYYNYLINTLSGWLAPCQNRDVVIEGYELLTLSFRAQVINLLKDWSIIEINTDA